MVGLEAPRHAASSSTSWAQPSAAPPSVAVGSPWIDGKSLAIASPATLIAAMAAFAWLVRSGRRVEAAVAMLAVAGGVLWSNVLAYHDVWLAPRSQLRELESIGKQFSGDGPALLTEYAPYGVRHFLRHLDPEGASELRYRLVLLRNGQEVEKGGYADIDDFQLDGILVYRTLVLVHSPSASRPPSVYRLVWSGPYYDVWQRPEPMTTRILEHLPLGDGSQPGAVPACGEVLRLGRAAAAGNGRVAVVVRPEVTVVDLSAAVLPAVVAGGRQPGRGLPIESRALAGRGERSCDGALRHLDRRLVPPANRALDRRAQARDRAEPSQPSRRRHAARAG